MACTCCTSLRFSSAIAFTALWSSSWSDPTGSCCNSANKPSAFGCSSLRDEPSADSLLLPLRCRASSSLPFKAPREKAACAARRKRSSSADVGAGACAPSSSRVRVSAFSSSPVWAPFVSASRASSRTANSLSRCASCISMSLPGLREAFKLAFSCASLPHSDSLSLNSASLASKRPFKSCTSLRNAAISSGSVEDPFSGVSLLPLYATNCLATKL
mmetsp:Transcript_52342/g.124974  ORF Transcript_52342/g.124974 Transcript_52342/m.124974 type:complete len:216 (-) Transcript_52342:602-1249(-)